MIACLHQKIALRRLRRAESGAWKPKSFDDAWMVGVWCCECGARIGQWIPHSQVNTYLLPIHGEGPTRGRTIPL